MSKSLVIVESPAKAKTINKYLGSDYSVKASLGHVRDLPKKGLGVDLKNEFEPTYEIIPGKEKVIKELKAAAKLVESIYIATDPDREGEAIGWHLSEELGSKKRKIFRVMFNEITQKAIKEAFRNPGVIDSKLVDAQQARRILDRLVGYKISPLFWKNVRRGTSAGASKASRCAWLLNANARFAPSFRRNTGASPRTSPATIRRPSTRHCRSSWARIWRLRTKRSRRKSSSISRTPASLLTASRKPRRNGTPCRRSSPANCSRKPRASCAFRSRRP